MKFKINKSLLPVKAHFFFFFAALGPILPQLNVYGRQLGVSAEVMGYVTAGLPLLWAAAKPTFGYVVDFWPNHRKLVFMFLIIIMTGSYCGLWFIPTPQTPKDLTNNTMKIPEYTPHMYQNGTIYLQNEDETHTELVGKFICRLSCDPSKVFIAYLTNTTFADTLYVEYGQNISCETLYMNFVDDRFGLTCTKKDDCELLCSKDDGLINRTNIEIDRKNLDNNVSFDNITIEVVKYINVSETNTLVRDNISEIPVEDNHIPTKDNLITNLDDNVKSVDISKETLGPKDMRAKISKMIHVAPEEKTDGSFYVTAAFWSFVVLMCVGTVAFNVANCIGDAVCFDVLGTEGSKYGAQRAWGTAGYGVTAFLGGWLVDSVSSGSVKDFTPAFVLALAATAVDLFACTRLRLPALSSPEDSGAALLAVLRIPRVVVFICFAVVAGLFDSFIIYYMFWFLEDIAEQTGHQGKIKLIEGVVVAGQSFIGEIVFFALSGRIIKRWGYGVTLTLSLFCYGVRMACISLIQNPWHLIPIESVMQGPTYALCYSTIVGYAAHVAPPGYSATVQGVVAGMDDGVGFALGSLLGGQLYGAAGGRGAFRILAGVAVGAAVAHAGLYYMVTREKPTPQSVESPEEGLKMLPVDDHNAIYRNTTEPLAADR